MYHADRALRTAVVRERSKFVPGLAGLSQHLHHEGDGAEPPVSIEQLAAWVTAMAIATEPTINDLLRCGLDPSPPLEVTLMARHAATTFTGVAKEDHKIRSSIYATAALTSTPGSNPLPPTPPAIHPDPSTGPTATTRAGPATSTSTGSWPAKRDVPTRCT
jgi:hypothetical protein